MRAHARRLRDRGHFGRIPVPGRARPRKRAQGVRQAAPAATDGPVTATLPRIQAHGRARARMDAHAGANPTSAARPALRHGRYRAQSGHRASTRASLRPAACGVSLRVAHARRCAPMAWPLRDLDVPADQLDGPRLPPRRGRWIGRRVVSIRAVLARARGRAGRRIERAALVRRGAWPACGCWSARRAEGQHGPTGGWGSASATAR